MNTAYEKIKVGDCLGTESGLGIACGAKYGFCSGAFYRFYRRNVAGCVAVPDRSNRLRLRIGARFSPKKQTYTIYRRAAIGLTKGTVRLEIIIWSISHGIRATVDFWSFIIGFYRVGN